MMIAKVVKIVAVDGGYLLSYGRESNREVVVDNLRIAEDPNDVVDAIATWLGENEATIGATADNLVPELKN